MCSLPLYNLIKRDMRITSRRKTIAFFMILGICLVALAVALNVSWIILNWREGVLLFFGVIFFVAIILGLILNTGFLVREIRRNEQHDSFINAVTHELKTPIASIRLYLETLQRREVDEAQRQQFYRSDAGRYRPPARHGRAGAEGRRSGLQARRAQLAPKPTSALWWANAWTWPARATIWSPEALHWQDVERRQPSNMRATPKNCAPPFPISSITPSSIPGNDVDVSVRIEAPDENRVVLRVRDRGVGIPAGELKRIFKRFYRVRAVPLAGERHGPGTVHRARHCARARR